VPIKFKAIFNHGIARVLTGLANEKTKLKWVPKLREVKMIHKESASKFISYYRYDAPWPFEDRDFVIVNAGRLGSGPQSKTVFVEVKSVEHKLGPIVEGVTRATTYAGYSKITKLGENKTKIEMALLTDFGGHIPSWIINMVQKKWPYNFVKNYTKFLDENEFRINPAYIRQ
jgi:hypothetical protein